MDDALVRLAKPSDDLIAMFREPDSYAVYLLEEQGITRFDVVNYVSHGVSKIAAA